MISKNNFWNKKSVLITGINGFIGSSLAKELRNRGAIVWGISRTKEDKNIIKANIIDYSALENTMQDKKISICFHLAAESFVELGQENPYKTFKINTLGTLSILESAKKNNLEKLIIASTSQVYGDNPLPFKENYPVRPSRPYETSKACIDFIAQSYAETFNLPVLISRFCNIYGPGDLNFTRLIPKTIKSILSDNPPEMWGKGTVREYLYIEDAVEGYIRLAEIPREKIMKNRIFNFGTGKKYSVEDIIKKIIIASGKNIDTKKISGGRLDEIHEQYVSFTKAKKILGWSPKISIENGLKKTVRWYKNYFSKLRDK